MRRIGCFNLAFVLLVIGLSLSTIAGAQDGRACPGNTPSPNGAEIALRVFNDCPGSTLNVSNNYPAQIFISDGMPNNCSGYANLHSWSFSVDGGQTKAVFENCSHYRYAATVVLDGTGEGEGGLRLSPWWAENVDGRFMVHATTGEIACFGGRLPFYSFTVAYGLLYVKGTPARLDITYNPHSQTQADPATIIYAVTYGGNTYSSGPLAWDEGNYNEDPPHGLWGEMVPAYVGGYFQPRITPGVFAASFSDIFYEGASATSAMPKTWGKIKTMYR